MRKCCSKTRSPTDALIDDVVPIFIPEGGAKIRLQYAVNVTPTFATASELRDSLLASYPDAERFGGPLVGIGRDDVAPAWGWVKDFLLMRSDWWPAIGIALQHAATDGGVLAQTALVELLGHYNATFSLLNWTAPMAEVWPARRTLNVPSTGWGDPDHTLAAIVRDQREYMKAVREGDGTTFLDSYGENGTDIIAPLTNENELRTLLTQTARAGQSPGGRTGPWSWLGFEFQIGDSWLWPSFVRMVDTLDDSDERMIFALIDWFAEEKDLWRFTQLLQHWHARRPAWWETHADTLPSGWKRTIRSSFWPGVTTLGHAVAEALRRAKWQVVTPPVIDLPQLYGPAIF